MKYTVGLLGAACACMVMLVDGLAARNAKKPHTVGGKCNLKDLVALSRYQMEESLEIFDKANGGHLGTWSPGFPELEVHINATFNGPEVQCSLTFVAQGVEKILEDQMNNQNPRDVLLHKKLNKTVSRVNMLKACVENFFKGKCPKKPLPPTMPQYVFARKQWSHTLLMSAKNYLDWLEHKIIVLNAREINKKTLNANKTDLHKYLESSVHHL
ncbi:uncharacterized protein FYW61_014764 [Anableps anableps]